MSEQSQRDDSKDFATLQHEAAQHWAQAQQMVANRMTEQETLWARSPDVLMRPDPMTPWSHPGIVCSCGGTTFHVSRWITVNGVKTRFEATCTACEWSHTWDWAERRWVD